MDQDGRDKKNSKLQVESKSRKGDREESIAHSSPRETSASGEKEGDDAHRRSSHRKPASTSTTTSPSTPSLDSRRRRHTGDVLPQRNAHDTRDRTKIAKSSSDDAVNSDDAAPTPRRGPRTSSSPATSSSSSSSLSGSQRRVRDKDGEKDKNGKESADDSSEDEHREIRRSRDGRSRTSTPLLATRTLSAKNDKELKEKSKERDKDDELSSEDESSGGKNGGSMSARRRSVELSNSMASDAVRRRQFTDRRDRTQSARLDIRKRAFTDVRRSGSGDKKDKDVDKDEDKLKEKDSEKQRPKTHRDRSHRERDMKEDQTRERAGSGEVVRRDRRERGEELKKTFSAGNILARSSVEKEGREKPGLHKSSRDLGQLSASDDRTERKKLLSPATHKEDKSGPGIRRRLTPSTPATLRKSEVKKEEAMPIVTPRRGVRLQDLEAHLDDELSEEEEREAREKDNSARRNKGNGSKSKESSRSTKKKEDVDDSDEDDDSSSLTSSENSSPRRDMKTTSNTDISAKETDEDMDEDSTISDRTPRTAGERTPRENGERLSARRKKSLKMKENGLSSSDEQRKRGKTRDGHSGSRDNLDEDDESRDAKTDDEDDIAFELEDEEDESLLDAATIEYNSRLRKFVLECVENLMKTVTRWAVVVAAPSPIPGELRVVDITRYVDGTLTLLSGLKLGKIQRSASGRDLSKNKIEQQHSIHVSVNVLIKKLLKIKKQAPTLSSKNLPRFYQAFYAIRIFHETGEQPFDTSIVRLPSKSSLSAHSIEKALVASQFPDSETPVLPSQPNPLDLSQTFDQDYMMEVLKCRTSGGHKNRTIVLQRPNLLMIFSKNRVKNKDEKPLKVHDLRNTKNISPSYVNKNATKIKPQSFCLVTLDEEEIEMEANSKEMMAEWVLAIDGLCMHTYSTHLNAQFRSELLLHMYKNVYKGGVIKSSYEDEWSYFANGTLERVEPVNGRKLIYSWDGEVLQPVRVKSDEEPPSYGVGRWNGVWLTWYRQDYLLEEPLMRYLWVPSEKEFQTSNPLLTWKWTRHFLACKHGSGEWIMEGEVPSPVVMCLQLMRYAMAIRTEELHRFLNPSLALCDSSY